jgi:hypothetical protein
MAGWVERHRHSGRKAEYNSQQSKSDRDGRRVCAHIKVDYDQQPFPWVEVWHEDINGRQTDLQVHPLPAQPDNLTMMIAGPNVHLRVALHGATVDNRRAAWVVEMVLPNWYTPWPGQGMAGEPEGAATYIPQEAAVDLTPILQRLDALERAMPNMMLQAAKDAIREQRVLTEAMFAGGTGSHIVYQQLVNTSFTGAKGALDEQPFGDEGEVEP